MQELCGAQQDATVLALVRRRVVRLELRVAWHLRHGLQDCGAGDDGGVELAAPRRVAGRPPPEHLHARH
eukprot:CAMPEP_0179351822 /NCGR_PEP_ID=MMETSP0797-20121207/75475_1 /TAXON_ID=47934 /ORGANISM="Dinophysis acuminata, Strain DAEP01" /LENGTH=68 /DNA_ID=CAMNT_0021066789 /DNA_START=136 /DNA_END=339 /DNA_ORIENTATION=-